MILNSRLSMFIVALFVFVVSGPIYADRLLLARHDSGLTLNYDLDSGDYIIFALDEYGVNSVYFRCSPAQLSGLQWKIAEADKKARQLRPGVTASAKLIKIDDVTIAIIPSNNPYPAVYIGITQGIDDVSFQLPVEQMTKLLVFFNTRYYGP